MAKKKSGGKASGFKPGQKVCVREGVCAPEFPDISCAGWTGLVADILGKRKPNPQYVIQWDETTIAGMPENYEALCEEQNLLYTMACFPKEELEATE